MKAENLMMVLVIVFIFGVVIGIAGKSYFGPTYVDHRDTVRVDKWHDAIPTPAKLHFVHDTISVPIADSSKIDSVIRATHNADSLLWVAYTPWQSKKDTTISIGVKNDTSKILFSASYTLISYPFYKTNDLFISPDSIRIPEKTIHDLRIEKKTDWEKTAIEAGALYGITELIKSIIK